MSVLSVFSPSLWLAKWAGPVVLGVVLSGCSSLGSLKDALPSVGSMAAPYRVDIIQGNFVSREQAAAVSVGMSRAQVREILGTPLLSSAFHANRWDYVFTFRRSGEVPQQRRLTAFFKEDVLDRVESDELPTEAEFIATLDGKARDRKIPVLTASDAALKAFAEQNKPAPELPGAVPPITNYPPLEPPVSTGNR
jgi:outer membrane protein assembly factor BamE